jgi:glycerol-3-phosphate acyltransferase PlsY
MHLVSVNVLVGEHEVVVVVVVVVVVIVVIVVMVVIVDVVGAIVVVDFEQTQRTDMKLIFTKIVIKAILYFIKNHINIKKVKKSDNY